MRGIPAFYLALFLMAMMLLSCNTADNTIIEEEKPKALETQTADQNSYKEDNLIHMVVMDPLALELSCECVEGYAQRQYQALAQYLTSMLYKQVKLVFHEELAGAMGEIGRMPEIVIGKSSVIKHQALKEGVSLRRLALLTGKDGSTGLKGLFVVRADSPMKSLADLKDKKIVFGPVESHEKHGAAILALNKAGINVPKGRIKTGISCSVCALEVHEKKADAAVISSYAMPLLLGCETIPQGALKVIGHTLPTPFVGLFFTSEMPVSMAPILSRALMGIKFNPMIKNKLETRDGFVFVPDQEP